MTDQNTGMAALPQVLLRRITATSNLQELSASSSFVLNLVQKKDTSSESTLNKGWFALCQPAQIEEVKRIGFRVGLGQTVHVTCHMSHTNSSVVAASLSAVIPAFF